LSAVISKNIAYWMVKRRRDKQVDLSDKNRRFDNEWYYLLSGEIFGWSEYGGKESYNELKAKDALVVTADILCQSGGKLFIYTGIIDNYFFTSNGEIESLYLSEPVYRYPFESDQIETQKAAIATEVQAVDGQARKRIICNYG